MYAPEHFEVSDQKEIFSFIQANAFGQLISTVNNRSTGTYLPFLLDEQKQTLSCHLARNNPQWKNIQRQEVLVSFLGPHDYISPNWYVTPNVPTWNYQAAHLYGIATLIEDNEAVKSIVNALTDKYEAGFINPWQADYHEGMLNAIIGLEIKLTDIQCKYKLSQNKTDKDKRSAIQALEDRGSMQLANAMRKQLT